MVQIAKRVSLLLALILGTLSVLSGLLFVCASVTELLKKAQSTKESAALKINSLRSGLAHWILHGIED